MADESGRRSDGCHGGAGSAPRAAGPGDRSRGEPERADAPGPRRVTLHVAAVHGVRRMHLVTAAPTPEAVTARLADYVREHAEVQLRPEDARRVRGLLASGELEDAVAAYFASVGERWDEEWLVRRTVEADAPGAGLVASPSEALRIT